MSISAKNIEIEEKGNTLELSQKGEPTKFRNPYTVEVYSKGLSKVEGKEYSSKVIVEGFLGVSLHLMSEANYIMSKFSLANIQKGETLEIKSKGDVYKVFKGVN